MQTKPAISPARPEDAELSKKHAELTDLQSRLADLELVLLNLRLELSEFEAIYLSKVGPIYAELDEVEALIAERVARDKPTNPEAAAAAGVARKRAEASRRAAEHVAPLAVQPIRSDSLRDLYRFAAKRLHPDLSRDDADRKIRERLMADVNLAYTEGDGNRIRVILEEYDSSPDTVLGSDTAAELVRVIRRISLANKRIQQVERDISLLKQSELFQLKTLVDDGNRNGNSALESMVGRLKQQLDSRREYLRNL